jgi:hypothetical protein
MSNNKYCKSCQDPVIKFYDSELGREVNPIPYCRECYIELYFDKTPDVLSDPVQPSKLSYSDDKSDSEGMRKRKIDKKKGFK